MEHNNKKRTISIMTATGFAVIVALAVIDRYTGFTEPLVEKMRTGKTAEQGFIGESLPEIKDGKMTPEVLLALGRMSDPQVSPDGSKILYGISYISVEENRSCNNLYICNTDGSDRQRVTSEGKSISNARWSRDGKHIFYLQGGQIWSAALRCSKSGEYSLSGKVKISEIPAGIGQFSLSPDQDKIMYISTVQSAHKKASDLYGDLDKCEAFSADDLMYRHWDHWVKEVPHTFITDFKYGKDAAGSIIPENSKDILEGEKEIYELPTEPFGGIEQLAWSPDGKSIAYSCRKVAGKRYAFSTDTEIYLYDIESGTSTCIAVGGGYDTDPVWSPDGSKLCWVSMERDGYEADRQRLMVTSVNWKESKENGATVRRPELGRIVEISNGFKYNITAPVWDSNTGGIYFSSLAEGIQGVFMAFLEKDTWKIERITGEDLWYDFNSPFHIVENNGQVKLLATYCSMNFPTEMVEITVGTDAEGKIPACEVEHNKAIKAECRITENAVGIRQISNINGELIAKLGKPQTEARYIRTADGKDMLTWVVYPPEFDKTKKYPSILVCLGGPQGTLSQGWSYRWNYRLMASQGYITVLPNRHGTTAFGQEWTEQISGDYCGLNMDDYLRAAKSIKAEPFVDKMAACGASYGGYSVYNLCGIHGDVFDAFIAHAGIFNQEHMYMTTEELWFPNWDNGGLEECKIDPSVGTASAPIGPAGDGKTFGGILQGGSPWSELPATKRHYANSPHKKVTKWHTPLLVMHGAMDFRVPLEQGMAAYNAAQLMGVPSRLIVFPEENHWILKPQNALYWHREYFRWLDRWCK